MGNISARWPIVMFALVLGLIIGPGAHPAGASLRAQAPNQPVIPVKTGTVRADELPQAIAQARPGDTLLVQGGVYVGALTVDKAMTLVGVDWPVLDGQGQGTVLTLAAAGSAVQGFIIRNSGDSLNQEHSGISVSVPDVRIENNRLENVLFGVNLAHADRALVRGNTIHGQALDSARRGDLIKLWYSHDVVLEANHIQAGRDLVLWYSERLTLRHNVITQGRYGLHFMYCDDAEIAHNTLTDNSVGAYLMYSRRIQLHHNTIAYNRGPSGYGLGLKDIDDAMVVENLFINNRVGAYVDGSPRELSSTGLWEGNVFAYNDIGLTLLPSTRRNHYQANSFIENGEQVSIAGGGVLLDNLWTVEGQGNYWSDYAGYDAAGDGVGDVAYQAERLFENMLERDPNLRLFLYSPATHALEFAARAFPLIRPQPKLTDDAPMMRPRLPSRENGSDAPPLPNPSPALWPWLAAGLLGLAAVIVRWPFATAAERLNAPERVVGTPPLSLVETGHPMTPSYLTERRSRFHGCRGEPVCSPLAARIPESRGAGQQPTSSTPPLIVASHLGKRFGALTALQDLSFSVRPGEAVALWGANGAGKTTALRCLLNLFPFEGQVTVGGLNVRQHSKAARRQIGFVPQTLALHDDLTVDETLLFYRRLRRVEASAHLDELLERLGLTPYRGRRVGELSGGLKQRLALALALLSDPPALILDEPTANLDLQAREDFLHLLRDLKKRGKALVFSSHRLEEATQLADRVLLLENGRLVADAPPDQLGQRLGWQATLHIYLAEPAVDPALSALAGRGWSVSRNGRGVRVQVAPGQKGEALRVLHAAGVTVQDFMIE